MKKRKFREVPKQGAMDAELDMTQGENVSVESLRAISKENSKNGLSLHADNRLYFGGKIMSEEDQVKAIRRGTAFPRFNVFAIFSVSKEEMEKIFLIWNARITQHSNIMFDLNLNKVILALSSPSDETTDEELCNFMDYFTQGKACFFKVKDEKADDLPEHFMILQKTFDEQTYYMVDNNFLFSHKLGLMVDKGWVLPFSTIVEDENIKMFSFSSCTEM